MVKKILLLSIFTLMTVVSVKAQNSWGVKGSLVFNSSGELIDEVGSIIDDKGKGEAGFNAGLYGVLNLGPIFLRPELLYTSVSSEYTDGEVSNSLKTTSIDLPVLVGIKIIGPLRLFAGPAFKYILDNKLGDTESKTLENDITVGLNIGVSVELGRLGIDVTYDRGFSSNEAIFIGENIDHDHALILDTRPEQIKIGLSYRLSSNK